MSILGLLGIIPLSPVAENVFLPIRAQDLILEVDGGMALEVVERELSLERHQATRILFNEEMDMTRIELEVVAGDLETFSFTLKQRVDGVLSSVDLTNAVVKLLVRRNAGDAGPYLVEATGIVGEDPATGQVSVTIAPEQTSALNGRYPCQVKAWLGDNSPRTFGVGVLIVLGSL